MVFDKKEPRMFDFILISFALVLSSIPVLAALQIILMMKSHAYSIADKQKEKIIYQIMNFNIFGREHICRARPYNH